MKKMFKKMAVMVAVVAMAVSATVIPASASSVSGGVGGTSCGGSNSITSTGASAQTWAGSSMTLSVKLSYYYTNIKTNVVDSKGSSNANNPVSRIYASASRPSAAYRSYYCYSTHTAVYNGSWNSTTTRQYYPA